MTEDKMTPLRERMIEDMRIQGMGEWPLGDRAIQGIAAKHRVHPTQVSTWKNQAVEGLSGEFSGGGKPSGPSESETKDLHANIGRLAVENDLLVQGRKR